MLFKFPFSWQLRIPDAILQKYEPTHEDELKRIQDEVLAETTVTRAVKDHFGDTSASRPADTQTTPDRTTASPQWDGDLPLNLNLRLALTPVAISEFDAGNTYLGSNWA